MDYRHSQLIASDSIWNTNSHELCIQTVHCLHCLHLYPKPLIPNAPPPCAYSTNTYGCPCLCERRLLCPCPYMSLLVPMLVPMPCAHAHVPCPMRVPMSMPTQVQTFVVTYPIVIYYASPICASITFLATHYYIPTTKCCFLIISEKIFCQCICPAPCLRLRQWVCIWICLCLFSSPCLCLCLSQVYHWISKLVVPCNQFRKFPSSSDCPIWNTVDYVCFCLIFNIPH